MVLVSEVNMKFLDPLNNTIARQINISLIVVASNKRKSGKQITNNIPNRRLESRKKWQKKVMTFISVFCLNLSHWTSL